MPSEWYYTVNGQQAPSPASNAQLKQLATAGQLKPTDLVWQDGMADWVPASSIKGLFPAAPTPAPERGGEDEAPLIETSSKVPRAKAKPQKRKPADDEDEADADEDTPRKARSSEGGLLDLHPLLVLVLSTCTGGLFGLVYIYLACTAYSAQANQRNADAAGRPLGKARHPLGVLVLSYLTCGFYFYYWVYMAMTECCAYTGRTDTNPRRELALMLIFPPYAVYVVIFRLSELIRSVQTLAKLPESTAVNHAYVFLNPCLFFALPFLSMVQQDALNQVWFQAS